MSYKNIIDTYYPSLTKGEQKVADYIYKNNDTIIYQSLKELSKNIGVGEATIIRFCNKIGLNGFQDLKLILAKESSESKDEEKYNYVDKVTNNIIEAINNTKNLLDTDLLNRVTDLIYDGKRILIYGVGSSGIAAQDMQSKLLRFGKMSLAVVDAHYQLMNSSTVNEDDLIIAFSLTGYTEDIIDSIKLAKENNATVVAITNHILSPVAELSDFVILTAGKESPIEGGSLAGKISQEYITDLICTTYAMRYKDEAQEMRLKTSKSISHKTREF